jgi:hypothetical protein
MSELTLVGNAGYAANVVEVTEGNLVALPGLDNLNAIHALGYQALVSKDIKPGQRVLLFPAETQLDENFACHNNLFRHSEYNLDETKKGYLEDNLRVRAIKLRGYRSDALVLPLTSVDYLFSKAQEVLIASPEGVVLRDRVWEPQTFDHVAGQEICRKYVRPGSQNTNQPARFEPDESLPPAIGFDIDGTLAHIVDRDIYDAARAHEDRLDPHVVRYLRSVQADGIAVVVMSGRSEDHREVTEKWLASHGIEYAGLFMRPSKDIRPDYVVKGELFDKHLRGKYNVQMFLDDRDQIVRLWRDMGIICWQVADGNF